MAAGILALLCLGGVGVVVSLYDDATKIERVAPRAVVNSFLGAFLANRDDAEAALYTCKTAADLTDLTAFRTEMINIERNKSVGISVSWSNLTLQENGKSSTVTADIQQTASDKSRLESSWRFGLMDQDGWRVCTAEKLA